MRLRSALLVLALTTAAPVMLVFLISAGYVYEHDTQNIADAALTRNRATLEAVDAEIRGAAAILRSLSMSQSLARGDFKSFHDESKIILDSEPMWRNILLTSVSGNQISNARLDWGAPLREKPIEAESLASAISTARLTVGNLAAPADGSGILGVPVRVPVIRGGQVVYVITAVLRTDAFQDILSRQRLPDHWASGIVGTDGRLIARVPGGTVGASASTDYLNATKEKQEGWYRGKTLEGDDTYTAFSRSQLTNWSIGYAMPANVILGGARRAAFLLTLGLALSIGCAVWLSLWLTKRIAGPVGTLAEAARWIGTNRTLEVPKSGITEIDQLRLAISATSGTIRERDALLRESKTELERQATKLREQNSNRSRFLALLSHELRNPLAPLKSGLSILRLKPDDEKRTAIEVMMNRQIDHLTRLIDDLLDLGRIDRGQIELKLAPTDLLAVARHTAETVESAVTARRHQLNMRTPDASVWVNGDATRLEQVIGNLLTNAIKYTPPAGAIELRIDVVAANVVLSISDTGIGFSEADCERLFEMFTRLPEATIEDGAGLGIGLSLAKALIELHGGEISARSDGLGRGATFAIQLPAIAAPTHAAIVRPASNLQMPAGIVVADDNIDAAQSLADFLRLQGVEVHVAFDGIEALELLRRIRPAIAFLDINMPRADGCQVAREVREEAWSRDLVLIALTGKGQMEDRQRSQDAGFDVHLVKPADLETLGSLLAMTRAQLAEGSPT